jgi:hypothetical protein
MKRILWGSDARAAPLIGVLLSVSLLVGCSVDELDSRTTHVSSETTTGSAECCDGSASDRAVELFGTFDQVEASGDAETVVKLPSDAAAAPMGIVRFSYSGDSPAVVWGLDEKGDEVMMLVDSTMDLASADPNTFDGDSSWWAANEPPAALRVEASGPWELTVLPVDALEPLPDSGEGTRAYLYDGPCGAFTGTKPDTGVGMSITAVSMRGQGGSIEELVSEQRSDPEFFGHLPEGPSVVFVNHRATWTLELPNGEQ